MTDPTSGKLEYAAALVQLSFLIQRVYAQASRDYDQLTRQQAKLLCMLLSGPVGMAELGASLSLEKSSLTGLVDRTEQRGLVTRVRDSDDRRVWQVALTDAGEGLARRFYAHVMRQVESLADLDPADREYVARIVNQILADYRGSADLRR